MLHNRLLSVPGHTAPVCIDVPSVVVRAAGSAPVWLGAVFLPWSTGAKFPWPCVQGPWARAVGVGSFWFHVGSQQEGLSCGCQLDSRAQQSVRRGSYECDKHSQLGVGWWERREDAGQQVKVFIQAERRESITTLWQ